MNPIERQRNGAELRRFLSSPAEADYRPRNCAGCGKRSLRTCEDGRVRCETIGCGYSGPATDDDLAEVFGSLDRFLDRRHTVQAVNLGLPEK